MNILNNKAEINYKQIFVEIEPLKTTPLTPLTPN